MENTDNLTFIPINTQIGEVEVENNNNTNSVDLSDTATPNVDVKENINESDITTNKSDITDDHVFLKISEITGGTVKSNDDLKSILESAKLKGELEQSFQQLKDEYETVKNNNPFANEYLQKLNNLYKSGANEKVIQAFQEVNRIGDLESLEPEQALIYKFQIEHGLSYDEAEQFINGKYKLNSFDDLEDGNFNTEAIQMKIDAKEAIKYLQSHKASFDSVSNVGVDKPQEVDLKTIFLERTKQVEPILKNIEQIIPNDFKSMNINGLSGDKAMVMDYDVPLDLRNNAIEAVKQFAITNDLDLSSKEVQDGLKQYAKNIIIQQSFESIVAHAVNTVQQKMMEQMHNPEAINRGNRNPDAPKNGINALLQKANEVFKI